MAPRLSRRFLSEELLQRLDEGIRIAQRFGDGLLFGFGRRKGKLDADQVGLLYMDEGRLESVGLLFDVLLNLTKNEEGVSTGSLAGRE